MTIKQLCDILRTASRQDVDERGLAANLIEAQAREIEAWRAAVGKSHYIANYRKNDGSRLVLERNALVADGLSALAVVRTATDAAMKRLEEA